MAQSLCDARALRVALLLLAMPLTLAAQGNQLAEIEIAADSSGQPIAVNGRQMGVTPATVRIPPAAGVRIEVGRGARMRGLTLDVPASARIKVEMTMPRDTQPLPRVRTQEEIQRSLSASNNYTVPSAPVAPIAPRRPGFFGSLVIGGALIGGGAFVASSGACDQSFTSPAPSGGYVDGKYYAPGEHTLGVAATCQAGAAAAGALIGAGALHLIRRGSYKSRQTNFASAQARHQTAQVAYERSVQDRDRLLRQDVQKALDADQAQRVAVASNNDRAIRANQELPLVTFLNTTRSQVVGGRTNMVPPALRIQSVSFEDADGDSVISAGERATVKVRLQNTGRGAGVNVRVDAKSTSRLRFQSALVGTVAAGDIREAVLEVIATQDVTDEQAALDITLVEANGFDSEPLRLLVPVMAYRPPNLSILGAQAVDAEGRTVIRPGSQATVTVRVQNRGQGLAETVRLTIALGDSTMFFADNPTMNVVTRDLGRMRAGAFQDVKFEVIVNNRATRFALNASLTEQSGRYSLAPRDLGLQLNRPQQSIAQVVAVEAPRPVVGGAGVVPGTFGSDLLLGIPRVAENPNAFAVIIGNSQYLGGIPPVQYAANDAAVMRQYAEQSLGVRPGNIEVLNNATMSQLRTMFGDRGNPNGRLRNRIRPGVSEIFVFYSGHGAPDAAERKAYIMPVDADASLLSLTGYSVDVLYENLAAIGAKHVTVVIDACFSGATGGGDMLIRSASPIGIQVNDPAQRFQGGNATIIAAAEGQQLANWYDEKNHGLLTYFFLKGLQGQADADKNGEVSVTEMRAFLTDPAYGIPYEARRLHSREQTPQVFGSGEWTLRSKPVQAAGQP